jgi:hypothetical protein
MSFDLRACREKERLADGRVDAMNSQGHESLWHNSEWSRLSVKLSTASIGRLGEQQRTVALSKPRELEMWITGRCKRRIQGREEI